MIFQNAVSLSEKSRGMLKEEKTFAANRKIAPGVNTAMKADETGARFAAGAEDVILPAPPAGGNKFREIDRAYAAVRNVSDVEQKEIRNVVMGVLSPTLREKYLTLNYHRAGLNVELLLTLKDTRQFQAIALLARTIFELAVEVKLISLNADAAEKIDVATRIETLRYAKNVVTFKSRHPDSNVPVQDCVAFVAMHEKSILAEQNAMWPGVKDLTHWTMKKLPRRVALVGDPFEQMYEMHYAPLSWYSHGGVTGLSEPNTELFAFFAGIAYKIAGESYIQLLEVIINEFKLFCADPTLKDKLSCAKLVAYANNQEEADVILRAHGLTR